MVPGVTPSKPLARDGVAPAAAAARQPVPRLSLGACALVPAPCLGSSEGQTGKRGGLNADSISRWLALREGLLDLKHGSSSSWPDRKQSPVRVQ